MKPRSRFLCILTLLVSATAFPAAAAERPHMVLFLSDDHTWRDSSVYGSPDLDTPHMARLATAGMTFDRAYVASPSCAPSRAALLTGLYPANNGAEPNHSRPRPEIAKLPAHLQALGYEVAAFGKVGHYRQTPEYGFDIARHFGYHEDIAISEAVKWLRQRQDDRPLCLLVGTNWPHVPWPEDLGEIDPAALLIPPHHVANPVTRHWRAKYAAAIKIMDDELGLVYDAAREVLGENVFFLHTSDHGAQWPRGKWTLYEDGVRTPLIASWPGRIPAGVRSAAMVSWIDILPTLVEIGGGEAPAGIDGRSFLPVLKAKTGVHRDLIFTTHSGDGNNNVYPIRSVVTPDGWKYIRNLRPELHSFTHVTRNIGDNGYWDSWLSKAARVDEARRKVRHYIGPRPAEELYHVDEDPWESRNLAGNPAQAGRLADLRARLDAWMTETGDPQEIFSRPVAVAPPGRPNIVTVFVDDMGFTDLSCFGGTRVETPHIDRLASEGIRFTQFYVNSPICSPSRVALATGQYPQRWRIASFLNNRQNNRERGMAQWLDPQAPVLARELRHAGYRTGHFGKWHMGGQRDVDTAPPIGDYGFDRSLTNFEGMGAKLLPLTLVPGAGRPSRIWEQAEILGSPFAWTMRYEITGGFVTGALEFIDHSLAASQPFFLNVWPEDPHGPWFPRVENWSDDPSERYYAVLREMDEQLAPLFDRLRDDKALRDNTLVIFCSDNGHEHGIGNSDPLRGSKTWLYEGGIRSPLIVWGPGLLAEGGAGRVNETSVFSAIDLNRSLYALTETSLPEGHALDGENVLDTLLGRSDASRQAPIFFRRPPDRPGFNERWGANENNPDLAVRGGKWKYLVDHDGGDPQLYDLEQDPSESVNLVAEQPGIAARLQKILFEWNAAMPPDAGDPRFEPAPDRAAP